MFKRFKDDCDTPNPGQAAELFARQYLQANKLKIVEVNYTTPRGELDIIAKEGHTLVFVEVRLRSCKGFGSAADSIHYQKQRSLIYAASHYLQNTNQYDKINCRFDALCLTPDTSKPGKKNSYQVEWIRNAFGIE